MTNRPGRFELEWWVVQKRMIYLLISLGVTALLAGGFTIYAWKYGNPFVRIKAETMTPEGARFISFEGEIRVIRASTRETITANSQIQLYPGDTVQTQTDGRARIGLADGSILLVRPNSTVIIRDNTTEDNGQRPRVRVQVDSGQINVRTEQLPDGTRNVVETPQTRNQLASQTGASFGVNPADHLEEIRVTSGQIETVTNNGDKTVIRGGEYASINPTGTLTRQKLLESPTPQSPADLEKVFASPVGSANVTLKWQRPSSGTATHYRVEVATSPFFVAAGKVIERDQLAANELGVSDLRPGNYFWRVRATAASGQISDWTEPQKFLVVPRGGGASVPVTFGPADYIGGNIYILRGKAEPGTTIRAGGRETLSAADGAFQIQVSAPPGAGEMEIEAFDPQGNRNQFKVPLSQSSSRSRR
jgi:FecR protein/Fibronectin type III domain